MAEAILEESRRSSEIHPATLQQFSEMLFVVKGTALQLGLQKIVKVAELSEELAERASQPGVARPHLKKALAALWDTLSTLKWCLEQESSASEAEGGEEEREILIHRIQSLLEAMGGRAERVSEAEIEVLLQKMGRGSF